MPTRHQSTSSAPGSPAKTSRTLDTAQASTGNDPACGGQSATLLAVYDPDGCCWKTCQQSLLTEDQPSLDRLPKSGTTVDGSLYELPTSGRRTGGNVGSVLLATPRAADGMAQNERRGPVGRTAVSRDSRADRFGKYWPAVERWERITGRAAPRPAHDRRLNPVFVEWMMGLPEGWVTGCGLSRSAELRVLGNGIVPAQAAEAVRRLL